MPPQDFTLLLQNILDRLKELDDKIDSNTTKQAVMDAKIDTIATKQALIESQLDEHVKSGAVVKSNTSGVLEFLKSWGLGILFTLMLIFQLGRCSVEAVDIVDKAYTAHSIVYDTTKAKVAKSKIDDTSVKLNDKIDNAIDNKLLKVLDP